jgi:hypothetical protein
MNLIKILITAAIIAVIGWSAANAAEFQDLIKVMKDAIAARHRGALPETVSKADADAANQVRRNGKPSIFRVRER